MSGLLGLRRRDQGRPVVRLPLTGVIPPHPTSADYLSGVPSWNGDTNNQFGTCGPCSVANSAILTWRHLAGLIISVSDAAIFDLYRRSGNPGFDPVTDDNDNGVDMTVMLAELVKNGVDITHSDGTVERVKPLCFAEVSPGNVDAIRAATSICGSVLLAWDLDTAQQSQTVWDYVPGSSPWGGHATCGGAYTGAGGHSADERLVSWMQVYGTTDAFVSHQLAGAFIVVWPALWNHPAFQAGVDQAALASDYTSLTGRSIPAPVPPAPAPTGNPDVDLWDGYAKAWSAFTRTRPDLVQLQSRLTTWAAAKQLT